jgi:hypothetical protein
VSNKSRQLLTAVSNLELLSAILSSCFTFVARESTPKAKSNEAWATSNSLEKTKYLKSISDKLKLEHIYLVEKHKETLEVYPFSSDILHK